jgi:hypothetical protein
MFGIFTPIYGPIWDFYVREDYIWDCFFREKFVAPIHYFYVMWKDTALKKSK